MSAILNDLAGGGQPGPAPSTATTTTTTTGSETAPGYDPAEVETMRRYYGADWTPPAQAAGGTQEGAIARTGADVAATAGMDPAEARAMAEALIRGGMDPAKVNAALRHELGDQAEPPKDSRSEAQREWDHQHGFDRDYTPEDYAPSDIALSYRDAGAVSELTPGAVSEWQQWAAGAELPKGMEGSISQLLRDARMFQKLSPAERTLYNANQIAQAKISAGSTAEGFAERERLAGVWVKHMVAKGGVAAAVTANLVQSGALSSVFGFNFAANLGQRIEAYTRGYPKDE